MADTFISQLPTIEATGNTVIPVSYNGVTYKIAVSSAIDTIGTRTGALKLPSGNVAQRENIIGSIRYNSQYASLEFYNGSAWQLVASTSQNVVEALIIGGGGAGGGGGGYGSGGGGAGGLIYVNSLTLTPGVTYPVTVGQGGARITNNTYNNTRNNGGNSAFSTYTAIGGGGGAANNINGADGGSGGGGCGGYTVPQWSSGGGTGTAGQGFNGNYGYWNGSSGNLGYWAGAGGGAGEAGKSVVAGSNIAGVGGAGLQFSITGSLTYYAGGGGGGASYYTGGGGGLGGGGTGGGINNDYYGQDGVDGLGGGGGGAGAGTLTRWGGKGGNGTVIIAYPGTVSRATITNGTTNTSSRAGYIVHTFTQNGSLVWNG